MSDTPDLHSLLAALGDVVGRATPGPWRADVSQPDDVVVWGPRDPANREHDDGNLVGNITASRVTEVGVALDVDAANARAIAILHNVAPALIAVAKAEAERRIALNGLSAKGREIEAAITYDRTCDDLDSALSTLLTSLRDAGVE